MGEGDARVELEGRVVVDGAVGAQDTAVAVARVLVEAEVRHEHDLVAEGVAQTAQGHLGDAVAVPRRAAELVFRCGHAKEDDARDAGADERLHLIVQRGDRVLEMPGQREDGLGFAQTLCDKERRDEVTRREHGLGDEAADGGCSAKTTWALGGKHGSSLEPRLWSVSGVALKAP